MVSGRVYQAVYALDVGQNWLATSSNKLVAINVRKGCSDDVAEPWQTFILADNLPLVEEMSAAERE